MRDTWVVLVSIAKALSCFLSTLSSFICDVGKLFSVCLEGQILTSHLIGGVFMTAITLVAKC